MKSPHFSPKDGGTCPHCKERGLKWFSGFSGSREEPEEKAGFECQICGEWSDEDVDPGDYGDYLYECRRDRELDRELDRMLDEEDK